MTPDQHLHKAARIVTAMSRLSIADYEMVIEAAMLAGTHWLNAILHRRAVTAEDADVMHAEYMSGAVVNKAALIVPGAVDALASIEWLRPGFVRGDVPDGSLAAEAALQALDRLRVAAGVEQAVVLAGYR
ncbi:MAG: hypothetical protein AB7G13_18560 [Lautropia sp.]